MGHRPSTPTAQALLRLYHKAQTVEGMERALAEIHARGISVHGQIADSLVNGDTINAFIRLYAHNLNRRWLRNHREFLRLTEYLDATQ